MIMKALTLIKLFIVIGLLNLGTICLVSCVNFVSVKTTSATPNCPPQVLQYPDSRLHRQSKYVTNINKTIKEIIADMYKILEGYDAGLATTQLNITKPPKIFVLNRPAQEGGQLTFINPKIVSTEGTQLALERCFSIYPNQISAYVKRAETVIIKATDYNGAPFVERFSGFWAWVVQHEIDHLNGILYIDRLSSRARAHVEQQLKIITQSQPYAGRTCVCSFRKSTPSSTSMVNTKNKL